MAIGHIQGDQADGAHAPLAQGPDVLGRQVLTGLEFPQHFDYMPVVLVVERLADQTGWGHLWSWGKQG